MYLICKKIKKVNILPDEFIINPVNGAFLHSPEDTVLSVSKEKPEAYVVDRIGYDKFLAQIALDSGAELRQRHRPVHSGENPSRCRSVLCPGRYGGRRCSGRRAHGKGKSQRQADGHLGLPL